MKNGLDLIDTVVVAMLSFIPGEYSQFEFPIVLCSVLMILKELPSLAKQIVNAIDLSAISLI